MSTLGCGYGARRGSAQMEAVAGGQAVVTRTLLGEGHDGSEDGSGRGIPLVSFNWQSGGDLRFGIREEATGTLGCEQTPAIAYQCHGSNVGPMGTLRSHGSIAGLPFVAAIQDASGPANKGQGSIGVRTNGPMYTLHSASQHGFCAPLTTRPYADHTAQEGRLVPVPALTGRPWQDGFEQSLVSFRKAQKAHSADDCERWEESETCPALDAGGHAARTATAISGPSGIRRLTPRECERLQGFPDDWTRWADDGREIADSPRYRMIGNAVTWPVAQWIGRRLKRALEAR